MTSLSEQAFLNFGGGQEGLDFRLQEPAADIVPALSFASTMSPRTTVYWEHDTTIPVSGARRPNLPFRIGFSTRESGGEITKDAARKMGKASETFTQLAMTQEAGLDYILAGESGPATQEQFVQVYGGKLPGISTAGERYKNLKKELDSVSNDLLSLMNTPTLDLRVSPTTLTLAMTKLILDGDMIRDGFAVTQWGDNLDVLTGSGKIGAFYAVDNGLMYGGLTNRLRRQSAQYQQLMAWFDFYRSNGYVYDTLNQGGQTKLPGALIEIQFGNSFFIGRFQEFSITDGQDSPFTLEYSFTFNCFAIFLNSIDLEASVREEIQQSIQGGASTTTAWDRFLGDNQHGKTRTQQKLSDTGAEFKTWLGKITDFSDE